MAEEKRKRSIWRKWDLFAAISALFWLQFFGQYPHYSVIGLLSIPIILILLFSGNQYNTDIERSDTYKKNTRTFRIVMYSSLIVSVLLCFSARWDIKWYYPVQKKIYGTNSDIEDFLPDKLPDKTENYEAEFIRGVFPGSSRIEISFFTDKKTIDEYRAFASSRSMTEKMLPVQAIRSAGEVSLKISE